MNDSINVKGIDLDEYYCKKSSIVYEILLRDYTKNQLVDWLIDIIGEEVIDEILENEET